ncbi:hypothetical protein GCM10023321_82230 [Pseudonocardia eucalypti]|uniref:Uncharacterized protein n=1 Tax=Pseudonocardia eucalypti TaxID=648755 RepID=A0ABP9REU6_9PSEU
MPATLIVAILVGIALGWAGAMLTASADSPEPPARAPAAAPAAPAPAPAGSAPAPAAPEPAAPTAAQGTPPGVRPLGLAEPAPAPNGLVVTALVTKMKGGVVLTLVAQNNGDKPVRTSTDELGPGKVTFRGAAAPMDMPHQAKLLAPGESLVYPCRVRLPDMDTGEMSFTFAGITIIGKVAGD